MKYLFSTYNKTLTDPKFKTLISTNLTYLSSNTFSLSEQQDRESGSSNNNNKYKIKKKAPKTNIKIIVNLLLKMPDRKRKQIFKLQ